MWRLARRLPTSAAAWTRSSRALPYAARIRSFGSPSAQRDEDTHVVTLPDPSTSMATSTLPLPGGSEYTDRRNRENSRIAAAVRRLQMPADGHMAESDIIWCSPELCFVGIGAKTTWPAFHAALNADVFQTRRVVAVRDCFDRGGERQTLRDFCAMPADDVLAVTKPVIRDKFYRRLVNEYSRPDGVEDGRFYTLVKNDMSFVTWIHNNGFRLLASDDKASLERACNGGIPTQQSSNHCLMVSPTAFSFNREAAEDNYFMDNPEGSLHEKDVRTAVLREYAALYDRLVDSSTGVGAVVHLFTHSAYHSTPDALFPNNHFSSHPAQETGDKHASIVLYPMKSPSRRRERRPEFIERLLSFGRFSTIHDLSQHESARSDPSFLEGTGALVLDRRNRIAYVALSPRADPALARLWARIMDYQLVMFDSVDAEGRAIYHTNVMMAIGTRAAIVCSEAIPDARSRAAVFDSLRSTGHEVVDISLEQVSSFCGNCLEMESYLGEQKFVMSSAAYNAFSEDQRAILLDASGGIVHSPISTIERYGGGGVRCAIAELF